MLDLATVYVRTYLPGRVLAGTLARALRLLIPLAGPLDRRLMRSRDGHVLASSVFVHARKPLDPRRWFRESQPDPDGERSRA
jgi:hypothetical protein